MMEFAQTGWMPLCGVAFALGARHALDADHVSVIDGIARRGLQAGGATGRLGGVLFSLGHCLVVAAVTMAAAAFAAPWRLPAWVVAGGMLTSALALLMLGALNLSAASRATGTSMARAVGWKARIVAGTAGDYPLTIIGVGALFALSFDSLALATAFGFAAKSLDGVQSAIAIAFAFGIGMIAIGGANGFLVASLLRSRGPRAAAASRYVTGAIGLVNMTVGAVAIVGILSPSVETWSEQNGLAATTAISVLLLLAFIVPTIVATLRNRQSDPPMYWRDSVLKQDHGVAS